jgi:hypothetical protein
MVADAFWYTYSSLGLQLLLRLWIVDYLLDFASTFVSLGIHPSLLASPTRFFRLLPWWRLLLATLEQTLDLLPPFFWQKQALKAFKLDDKVWDAK